MTGPVELHCQDANHWLHYWPDGVLLLADDTRILAVSDRALELLSWRREQLLNASMHELICVTTRQFQHSLSDCPLCADAEMAQMKSGFWLSGNGEYVSVDYRTVALPPEATGHYVVHFCRNEQRPHSFAELKKFAEYIDKNPSPVVEFDACGQMLFCNPAMQELMLAFGFNDQGQARILPHNLVELCQNSASLDVQRVPVEVQVDDAWFNWHFSVLASVGGDSIIGYVFEVTEEKRAKEAASQARAQARRDFFAKMVHELRTPLNAIVGYSDLLLCRNVQGLGERDMRALRGIKVGGMQLSELISDTLDISKIEAGRMTNEVDEFAVATVVEDIREQMSYLAEAKKLDYQVTCDPALVIMSDRRKVRQVLVNLVSNAIKYTRKGEVRVTIQRVHDVTGEEAMFSIAVQDTGVGIPEEQRDILFHAYRQVRDKGNAGIQGTGLGLALVGEVVEILGGRITLESEYGVGSCFTVLLPTVLQENPY